PASTPVAPDPAPSGAGAAAYCAAALLAGSALMTLQTVANRIGGLALGSSPFTFASVVAIFVFCIAIGGFAVSALPRIPVAALPLTQWGLVVYLALLYHEIPNATYWAHLLRSSFPSDAASFLPFHASVLLALLAMLALPLALAGASLPLMFHELRQHAT